MKLLVSRNCPSAITRFSVRMRREIRNLRKLHKLLTRTSKVHAHKAKCVFSDGRLVLRGLLVLLVLSVFLGMSTSISDAAHAKATFITPYNIGKVEARVETAVLPIDIQYPVSGRITTQFTIFHPGVDIATAYGTPLKPIGDGRVIETRYGFFGLGNAVVIDHGDSLISEYGHLSKIEVKPGDTVTKDTVIGRIGSTGFSTGSHLHLEISDHGKTIDPLKLLPKE